MTEYVPSVQAQGLFGEPVILYGAGSGCASYFSIVQPKLKTRVMAILDRDAVGSILDLPIQSPIPNAALPPATAIVVTIGDPDIFADCKASLEASYGVPVIWMLDLYEFHCHFPTRPDIDSLLPSAADLGRANSLLEDELSRQVLQEAIFSHATRLFAARRCEPLSTQYLVPELDLPKEMGHLVHCGAHRGSTLEAFDSYFESIELISCFEPTPSFQDDLRSRALNLRRCTKVAVHPVAVGDQTKAITLEEFGGSSTNNRIRLGETADSLDSGRPSGGSTMVALDEIFLDCAVDFVSMDIEGGEAAALEGARALIAAQRPRLAISVYHSPEDIWSIPLIIDSYVPHGYRMYLRRHTPFNAETLLYCIPR